MKNRSMVKLIHADGFFPKGDVESLCSVVSNMDFVEKEYGYELPNFNLIFPDIETIFYHVLGERVCVDPIRSGIIRKPHNNVIHFESFESTNEWCFIVALEKTTVNLLYHISDHTAGDLSDADAKSALDDVQFNYRNLFEWKIHTNILLEPNQGLFIRPWVFHSLSNGLVQYYRLMADMKPRILVMGLPGSNRSRIAHELAKNIEGTELINSMEERVKNKDIDFSEDGQLRHCYRLLKMARESSKNCVIINMTCPLPKMRDILNPDIIIWASDKDKCQYEDLNQMYVPPQTFDVECKTFDETTLSTIIGKMMCRRM
jgi:hypothetical protein